MKRFVTLMQLCVITLIAMAQNNNVHQQTAADLYQWPTEPQVLDKLHHWQDLKFGILLHWGIYSVPGIVESWSICDEDWITRDTTRTYQQYLDWYFGLADEFRPTRFDPAQWATVARQAGMKYMIFTTKHHDGFCMYDSHETDYTITRHAFKDDPRCDVLRHVLDAFRQQDFMIGTYFSKADWHSQDYWWDTYSGHRRGVNYNIQKFPWRWERFCRFTYRQIEEIMSGYGPVDILWLDAGWVCKENNQDIHMQQIAQMARRHQPGLIIVDRTIRGPYENYQTPEQAIPERQLSVPWESCITLTNDWGWVPRPQWKSPARIINTLAEIVAKGGNLVLGVGPTPQGLIQPEAVERLQAIGKWLDRNGRAIYGTVNTPHYHEGNLWFTAARDGSRRYAILALPDGEQLPATLSWSVNLPAKRVRLLSTGKTLKHTIADGRVTVRLPQGLPAAPLALEIE